MRLSIRIACLLAPSLLPAQTPAITTVVHAATSLAGPVAAGQPVAILGSNLAGELKTCSTPTQWPTVCAAVSVLVDDKPAPISLASPGQILFQAPWELKGPMAAVQVSRDVGGQTLKSSAVTVQIVPIAPGMFTSSGSTLGAFVLGSGSVITASNPARPGDLVIGYGAGFGPTNPPSETGKSVSGAVRIVAPVTVKVGGQDAAVQGAFASPSIIGGAQVSFTVPANAQAGNLSVVVTVGGINSPAVLLPVGLPRPSIAGVSNNASGAPSIASGSWVTIYGTGLASTTRTWRDSDFTGNNLPAALDGVSVKINGKSASVYYISPTQINVQAPTDSATGTVQVEVTNAGGVATGPANLQTYSPGFFTFSNKYPAAVHLDRIYVAPLNYFGPGVSRPAKPGDIILVFATGFGPTNPAVPAGQTFAGYAPLADPSQLRIAIGGVQAVVQAAGIVVPGQYQFNVVVPDVPDGEHPIVATIAGVSSQSGLVLPIQR